MLLRFRHGSRAMMPALVSWPQAAVRSKIDILYDKEHWDEDRFAMERDKQLLEQRQRKMLEEELQRKELEDEERLIRFYENAEEKVLREQRKTTHTVKETVVIEERDTHSM